MLRTELQKRRWYLDKFGVEREWLGITMAGIEPKDAQTLGEATEATKALRR